MIGRKKEVSTPTDTSEEEKLREENDKLKTQLSLHNEMTNLRDDKYFRLRLLQYLERISLALETASLEESESEKEE